MPLHFRRQISMGPIKINIGRKGYSSWGLKIGRWSWNSRTHQHSVDLPGPMSWRTRRKSTSDR